MIQLSGLIFLCIALLAMASSLSLVHFYSKELSKQVLYYAISKEGSCAQREGNYVAWADEVDELNKVLRVCPRLAVGQDGVNYTVFFIVIR